MPTESAFLLVGLLFLAAALGYVFAKFGDSEEDVDSAGRLNPEYLKGVNYLLNEEPDRAVEIFTRMVAFDDDALETHLALGSLFRKRGEVDRAIKVHQNLLARPGLTSEQLNETKMALAEDYLGAGLLDRAESLYMEMRESPKFKWRALNRLIRIFELTREWDRAIETEEELSRLQIDGRKSAHIAHYYCELAEQAWHEKDYARAREMLRNAESGRNRTVRSTMIRAAIAQDQGDHKSAIGLYEQVAREAPDLLTEVLPRLAASFRASDDSAGLTKFLAGSIESDDNAVASIAMVCVMDPQMNDAVAIDALQKFLAADSTLSGLVDAHRLTAVGEVERSQQLQRIRETLRRILATSTRYRCRECGYGTLALQWQCPSCRAWETVRPETHIALAAR